MKHVLLIHRLTSPRGIVLDPSWPPKVSCCVDSRRLKVLVVIKLLYNGLVERGFRVSTEYRFSSIAQDLRPYLEARNYSLVTSLYNVETGDHRGSPVANISHLGPYILHTNPL